MVQFLHMMQTMKRVIFMNSRRLCPEAANAFDSVLSNVILQGMAYGFVIGLMVGGMVHIGLIPIGGLSFLFMPLTMPIWGCLGLVVGAAMAFSLTVMACLAHQLGSKIFNNDPENSTSKEHKRPSHFSQTFFSSSKDSNIVVTANAVKNTGIGRFYHWG